MKKSELQQIIREEIGKVLNEQKSNIELIGPNIDELLDAVNFINTGVETNKGLQPHSFGKNTLKALSSDGHSIGSGKFSIGVELKVSNESLYIRQVNDLLDDHGFECKLYMTKGFKDASKTVSESSQINEKILKIRTRDGGKNQKSGKIDTSLIDSLLNQIGPYLGYSDWKEKIENPDYKGIIQKIAKHVAGIGTLGSDRLDIE